MRKFEVQIEAAGEFGEVEIEAHSFRVEDGSLVFYAPDPQVWCNSGVRLMAIKAIAPDHWAGISEIVDEG